MLSLFLFTFFESVIGILWPKVSPGENLGVVEMQGAVAKTLTPPHPLLPLLGPQTAHPTSVGRVQLFIYLGIRGKILFER